MEACGLDPSNLVTRLERARPQSPVVHYGLIASVNKLVKDALVPDKLEAEASTAGLLNAKIKHNKTAKTNLLQRRFRIKCVIYF